MKAFEEFLGKFNADAKYIWLVLGVALVILLMVHVVDSSSTVFSYAFALAPIWLPSITFMFFYNAWMEYVRKDFDWRQGRTTLEIKLPQEILKSPEAMELVLSQMYQSAGADNVFESYLDGKKPPMYGLEIVSRGGDVRFYINTPIKKYKNIIETQLYAQYPGIEVHQLDVDYTAEIPWDDEKYASYVFHATLKKADALPIKTYIDYGLKDMPKEEEKIDPITSVLETLGSAGPDERIWVQILIEANRELIFKDGHLSHQPDWKEDARKEIQKIIKNAAERVGVGKDDVGKNVNQFLTEVERDTIKAIERSLGKPAFNTAIRVMYIAKKDKFVGERISALTTMWRVFDDSNRNGIGFKWGSTAEWPLFQDPTGAKSRMYREAELDEYKRRTYSNRKSSDTPKEMTTEELATIFHLPGKVASTPTLGRIPSKRSEAPSNLPVG